MIIDKLAGIAFLGIFASVATGCGTGEASVTSIEQESLTAPLPVLVSTPKTVDIFAAYQMASTIASDAEAPILARVSGQVVEILVEEGDQVRKGQLLARLDGDFSRQDCAAALSRVT